MNRISIILLIFFFSIAFKSISADVVNKNKPQIGVSGGINQNMHFAGDLSFGINNVLGNDNIELVGGYLYCGHDIEFDSKFVTYNTHGAFLEFDYFFFKSIYFGFRLSWNYSMVDKSSQNEYFIAKQNKAYDYFLGSATKINIGYNKDISDKISLRVTLGGGLSSIYITSESINSSEKGKLLENMKLNHLYDARIGLVYRYGANKN